MRKTAVERTREPTNQHCLTTPEPAKYENEMKPYPTRRNTMKRTLRPSFQTLQSSLPMRVDWCSMPAASRRAANKAAKVAGHAKPFSMRREQLRRYLLSVLKNL